MFEVVGWSPAGSVNFQIGAVAGDTLAAVMDDPSNDWPFGEQLEIRIIQSNRGSVQINSGLLPSTFTVSPVIDNITPRIGGKEGGAIITISGSGLKFSKYPQFSTAICGTILSHTSTEIKCITRPNEPGTTDIQLVYYGGDPEITGLYYAFDTGYSFNYRDIQLSNMNHNYNDRDLHISADVPLPTAAINLRAFAIEVGYDHPFFHFQGHFR